MMSLACNALETAINQALKLDPDTAARLANLQGKVIKITLTDWQKDVFLLPGAHGLKLLNEYVGNVDTTICGTSQGIIRVACAGASGTALFDQGIVIIGDTELGEKIRDILRKVDLDWEGFLSRFVGDSISHEIAWRTKKAVKFGQETLGKLGEHVREFCQLEGQYLPKIERVESFYQDVAHVRDDVDRAAARLDRLEQRILVGKK